MCEFFRFQKFFIPSLFCLKQTDKFHVPFFFLFRKLVLMYAVPDHLMELYFFPVHIRFLWKLFTPPYKEAMQLRKQMLPFFPGDVIIRTIRSILLHISQFGFDR